jgi:hypothetical protein
MSAQARFVCSLAVLAAVLSPVVLAGCGPLPLDYMDFEAYVRPDVDTKQYKRAAILYVGFAEGSTLTQGEDVGARGKPADKSDEDRMIVTGSELQGADMLLFSNALITALDRRGVQLVERARIRDVVREQGLAANRLLDLDDTELVQRLGRLLKVDLIVRGSVFTYQGGVQTQRSGFGRAKIYYSGAAGLSVRGIDTRTGQVVWMETALIDRRVTPRDVDGGEPVATSLAINASVERMVARFFGEKR